MARFRFKAATAGGEVLEGELEAPTRVAAVDRLRRETGARRPCPEWPP